MNYNASLDDIIKRNRSKMGLKTKKWKNKNAKPALRSNIKKKQNSPIFKAKLKKKKVPNVPDARMKIIQNKKKIRSRSVGSMKSPLLQDARLKIEARRQKVPVPKMPPRGNVVTRGSAITSLAANGIIQRRINPLLSKDNGIRVEYEDDDMSLENEPLSRGNWSEQFTIRRTVSNQPERKRFPPTLMGYRDLDAEPEETFMEQDNLSFAEVTRTFANVKPSPSFRKNYSSRLSSPPRQSSNEDMRDISMNKSVPSRESNYYRIMISNLHENVTSEDIKELFEDIGDLVYAKMIRSGIAEVAYRMEKDAMDAVEIYHNRQLDGLPMKCTLINNPEPASSLKKRHSRLPPVSTKSSIEPDALIIKKALFNN